MRTIIKCKADYSKNIAGVIARELDFLAPTVDAIAVWEGWADAEILRRYFDVDNQTLHLTIPPDYTGEYSEKVKEEAKKTGQ